jgi:excisionase family DNA binding protein
VAVKREGGQPQYLTIEEAAALLRISGRTLDRLLARQALNAVRAGRRRLIPRAEIERFLALNDVRPS